MLRGATIVLLLALVPGCKRKPEAQPLAQDDGKGKTHACKLVAGGHIEKDTLVEADCEVWVSEAIRIEKGATLRIEAGARLAFTKAASLTVVDGVLVAAGEASRPVTFTSAEATKAAGDWGGIAFLSDKPGSSLTHAIVDYGGVDLGGKKAGATTLVLTTDARPGLHVHAAAAPVTLADLTVRHAPRVGILGDAVRPFARFEQVHVEDVGGIALDVPAAVLGSVTSLTSSDPVRVRGRVDKSATWPKVAAILVDDLRVYGTATEPAVLTLAPETIVRVQPRGQLSFGSGANAGALVAIKVVFTSAAPTPAPGDFRGLRFDRHAPGTRIEDCVIEFAGFDATSPALGPASKTPREKPVALALEEEMKDFVVRRNVFRNNAGPAIGRASLYASGGCVGLDVKGHGNTSIGQPLCQSKSAIVSELEKLELKALSSLGASGAIGGNVLKAGPDLDVLGASTAGVGGPGGDVKPGSGGGGGGGLAPIGKGKEP